VFVFVIDVNDTQADEAHLMSSKTPTKINVQHFIWYLSQ